MRNAGSDRKRDVYDTRSPLAIALSVLVFLMGGMFIVMPLVLLSTNSSDSVSVLDAGRSRTATVGLFVVGIAIGVAVVPYGARILLRYLNERIVWTTGTITAYDWLRKPIASIEVDQLQEKGLSVQRKSESEYIYAARTGTSLVKWSSVMARSYELFSKLRFIAEGEEDPSGCGRSLDDKYRELIEQEEAQMEREYEEEDDEDRP